MGAAFRFWVLTFGQKPKFSRFISLPLCEFQLHNLEDDMDSGESVRRRLSCFLRETMPVENVVIIVTSCLALSLLSLWALLVSSVYCDCRCVFAFGGHVCYTDRRCAPASDGYYCLISFLLCFLQSFCCSSFLSFVMLFVPNRSLLLRFDPCGWGQVASICRRRPLSSSLSSVLLCSSSSSSS